MSSAAAAEYDDFAPLSSEVSTTLSVGARVAYEVFADAVETPRWLPVVLSARVVSRYPDGRPERVTFARRLDRGSLSYTLAYTYDDHALSVSWTTLGTSSVVMAGEARFVPLSSRACLMTYRLTMDLPMVVDAGGDGHPASAVVSEFREHLRRLC